MSDDKLISIINSSTFGVYFPDLMERLEKIGRVQRINVKPDIAGKRLANKLKGTDYIIASVTPNFDADFFEQMDKLTLLARHGIGYNNVDIEAATKQGVAVTRVLGVHERDSVAELAIGLALNCLRGIIPAAKATQTDNWGTRKKFTGGEISKMNVGIIGYGNIGSRAAEIIKEGFGAEVMAYDPNVADAVIAKNGIKPVGFREILTKSDLISFHASLNPTNYHFISRKEFAMMKDGIVLVNTARGELMVEEDLVEAVKSGKVGAVGLDVVEIEPLPADSPLVGVENIHMLPHIGGYSDYSLRKMDEKMVEDVESVVAGNTPDLVINPDVFN